MKDEYTVPGISTTELRFNFVMDTLLEFVLLGAIIFLGGYILLLAGVALLEYGPEIGLAAAFIMSIVLINVFTLWASIVIFIAVGIFQYWNYVGEKKFTINTFYEEILLKSIGFTIGVVFAALAINFIFHALGSSGEGYIPCSRATPHGC